MSLGPFAPRAASKCWRNSSDVPARVAGTPRPIAIFTQSSDGLLRSSIDFIFAFISRSRTRAILEVENGVCVVLEDDDDDVGFFSRHRPQCLDGIHAAAIRLKMDDLSVGAGDRRAESHGQTAANRPAVDGVEVIVCAGPLGRLENGRAVRGRLVNENRMLRQQRAERLPDCFRRQPLRKAVPLPCEADGVSKRQSRRSPPRAI